MIYIENSDGVWTKWAAAVDETYGRSPHADLQLKLGKTVWRHKVKLNEMTKVARMLRSLADELEAVEKAGRARQRFRDQCKSATSIRPRT